MRLTVGPLSPAVYWRRRVLVIGTVLAVALVSLYMCGGSDGDSGKSSKNAAKGTSASANPHPTSVPPSLIAPSPGEPTTGLPANPNPNPNPNPNATGTPCADSEVALLPSAEAPTVRRGVPVTLYLRIKNISQRTCVRDVGANQQELYLQQNGAKVWSSDECEKRVGDDVVTFTPNFQQEYHLSWDGKNTAQGCANRQFVPAGTYQLFGRLGSKVSDPVTIVVTG